MNNNGNNQIDPEYMAARAEAPDIALKTAREDARKERIDNLLGSVADNNERVVTPMPTRVNEDPLLNDFQTNQYRNIQGERSRILDEERIAALSRDGTRDAIANYRDYLNTRYPIPMEVYPKQSTQIAQRSVEPNMSEKLRSMALKVAKKALIVGVSVAVAMGAGKMVYNNLKTPEPDPTPKAPTEQEIEAAREAAAQEKDPYEVIGYDQNGNPVVRQKVVSIESYGDSYDNNDVRGVRN